MTNNQEFHLMRSTDGENFSLIERILTPEEINAKKEYTFIDRKPARNVENYYKIIQVDTDGRQSESDIVSCGNSSNHMAYSNTLAQTFGELQDLMNEGSLVEVSILNASGALQFYFNKQNFQHIEMHLKKLDTGMYFVKMVKSDNSLEVKKILNLGE